MALKLYDKMSSDSSFLESKMKSDEGIYAANRVVLLSHALRGTAISRLALRQRLMGSHCQLLLGAPPSEYEQHIVQLIDRDTLLSVDGGDKEVGGYTDQPAVGLPDYIDDFRHVIPFVRCIKPLVPLNFDDYTRLMHLFGINGQHITILDLGACLSFDAQPESSPESSLKKLAEIRERYPLPISARKGDGDDDNDSDEEDDDEAEEDKGHNTELRNLLNRLQLPYTDYRSALSTLAEYEMNVFTLLCRFLECDTSLKALLLDNNQIGAESSKVEGTVELSNIRALARMIDANETLKVIDLSQNKLGPNGIGIVAKALTKNVSLVKVDLSDNQLNANPLDETEDPLYEEEDPVFGEVYSGLEAISEVLKKNKFLRILRLCHNGIHSGDDLTGEAPEEDFKEFDPENDATDTDVRETWDGLPLWRLVSPFMKFHKLESLDLTGNQLNSTGARMLASALSENHSLRVLNLTDNNIGFRGFHYIAKLVISSSQSKIHTYILRRNNLGGKSTSRSQQKAALKAMEAFATVVENNQVIRRLILNDNHLGPQLSTALLRTVGKIQSLEELDFSNNDACGTHHSNFVPDVTMYLAAALYPFHPSHRPALSRLRLSGNNIGPKGLATLFPEGFSPVHMLREVDLSRNDIGDALGPLGNALSISSIVSLNISFNSIYSLEGLYCGIGRSHSLKTLNVSHNFLGCQEQVGCVAESQVKRVGELFTALASSSTLVDLNLSWNDFRQEHGAIFTSVFSNRNCALSLRKLDISNNPKISADEVTAMIRHIASRQSLEAFDGSVSVMQYQPEPMLEVMNEVVRESESLQDLNLGIRQSCQLGDDEQGNSLSAKNIREARLRLLLNALTAVEKRKEDKRM